MAIDIVVPRSHLRAWQAQLIERLQALGHDVRLEQCDAAPTWSTATDVALGLEYRLVKRRAHGNLIRLVPQPATPTASRQAELTIDLIGSGTSRSTPVLSLAFDNSPYVSAALRAVMHGQLPDILVIRDGKEVIATARPMIDVPASTVLALCDVLARAVTIMTATITRLQQDRLPPPRPYNPPPTQPKHLFAAYATRAFPRLIREVLRRQRFHYAHWKVGYRNSTGSSVHETGRLGDGWAVLPDSEDRFFADPFAFQHDEKTYVFLEDYCHRRGKAVISVSQLDAAGELCDPVQIIEEPYHLSYPQVFERDGAIWMLPESSDGQNLVLYRATAFPHGWERHSVLFDGAEISDATLLDHGGKLWLFATARDGFGSISDTQVVYSATDLTGPWLPHRRNPIIIDRASARPGGAFRRIGNRIVLPVQDGSTGYGGHLGLCDLVTLNDDDVVFSPVRPIDAAGDWRYPRIHTLNTAGSIEVIDGIAPPPKRRFKPRR